MSFLVDTRQPVGLCQEKLCQGSGVKGQGATTGRERNSEVNKLISRLDEVHEAARKQL